MERAGKTISLLIMPRGKTGRGGAEKRTGHGPAGFYAFGPCFRLPFFLELCVRSQDARKRVIRAVHVGRMRSAVIRKTP